MKTRASIPATSCPKTLTGRLPTACARQLLPLMLFLTFPGALRAQFTYTTNNGTITITGYTGPGGAVTIPSTIDGLPVTTIGDAAFYYCLGLTDVTIPESITNIGRFAFDNCTSLTSVTIPGSVTSIGGGAFRQCTSLTGITVDARNPAYSSLDGVLFNKSQTTLVEYPGKTGSYTIPGSVTNIGDYAFSVRGVVMVAISDNVVSIGDYAFDGCGLSVVAIGKGVTSIGDGAFNYCPNLRAVIFQGNAPHLGSNVFSFWDPTIVYYMLGTSGWSSTFGGCRTELWDLQAQFHCSTNNGTITITGYTGPGGAVVIPSTINDLPVTSVGDSAFEYSTILTTLTVPDGVTQIGNLAFHACPYLTSVTISSTVTNIGYGVFDYCTGLTEITVDPLNPVYSSREGVLFDKNQTMLVQFPAGKVGSYIIPNGVVSLAAFGICEHLASVTVPNSLTNIGTGPFSGCSSLIAITVDALNPSYSSVDGVLFNKNQTRLVEYPPLRIGLYTIPDSVTSIEAAAFSGCRGLQGKVTIPNSVTNIGDGAFIGCYNFTAVAIPDSVTSIGNQAFQACISLNNVTIGNGVTRIGFWTFKDCVCLTNVTLGNMIGIIEWSAFERCASLTSIKIPESLSDLGPLAFKDCTSLRAIYFSGDALLQSQDVFLNDDKATVYYLPGTTGWGSTFGGRPTALWVQVPTLLTPPQTQTAEVGSAVGFSAQATNAFPLFYLWYLNQTNLLSSSTNCQLELTNVQFAQSGAYTVVISNVLGAITSAPVMLNVIAAIERRPVPGVKLTGEAASLLNVDSTDSLTPAPNWLALGSVSLTSTSQYYFDLTLPLPPQRFYRAWPTATPGVIPSLDLHMVPAITLTGNIGDSLRLDYINRFGPIDAWVTLDTVALTNTSQLYFDVSGPGQPERLYRVVQVP